MRVVGLGGSLARVSRSRAALQTALAGAERAGAETELLDIRRLEFSVRALRAWAVPYVVPVAAAARVFDGEGGIHDEGVARQLETLGAEVVRVAERFTSDGALHRQSECDDAAERVAVVA